jgi:hypothetical protein
MRLVGIFAGLLLLIVTEARASTIQLDTGFGGSASETISSVTLGAKVSFEIKALGQDFIPHENCPPGFICWVPVPEAGFLVRADVPGVDPDPGFGALTNAPLHFWSDWTEYEFDTSAYAGEVVDLIVSVSATSEFENWHFAFRNISIDGQELASIAEPATLLISTALTLFLFVAIRRSKSGSLQVA